MRTMRAPSQTLLMEGARQSTSREGVARPAARHFIKSRA